MSTQLQLLIAPLVVGLGYELVGIEHLPQGRRSLLRVYIDHANGITVEDCAKVSHQLSGVLEVEQPLTGDYQLEVSSPGLDRPLFIPEHFSRFSGRQAKIWLVMPVGGRRRFQGVLAGVDGDDIVVTVDDQLVRLTWSNIQRAKLVPEF